MLVRVRLVPHRKTLHYCSVWSSAFDLKYLESYEPLIAKNYPRFFLIILVTFPLNNIILNYLKSMERLLNEVQLWRNGPFLLDWKRK